MTEDSKSAAKAAMYLCNTPEIMPLLCYAWRVAPSPFQAKDRFIYSSCLQRLFVGGTNQTQVGHRACGSTIIRAKKYYDFTTVHHFQALGFPAHAGQMHIKSGGYISWGP
jgi:hypothetical protein